MTSSRVVRPPENNPFEPGFGDARVWVPRVPQTSTARSMILRAVTGSRQAPRLIEQERGYGKTTLLARRRPEGIPPRARGFARIPRKVCRK